MARPPPWRVSTDGANDPRWRADGRELFFVAPGARFFAAETTLGTTFSAGPPQKLFTLPLDETGSRQYDVSPDGRRLLVNLGKTSPDEPIVVILGWAKEIEKRLRTGTAAQ